MGKTAQEWAEVHRLFQENKSTADYFREVMAQAWDEAREAADKAVENEMLHDEPDNAEDKAYNGAIEDALDAVRDLPNPYKGGE